MEATRKIILGNAYLRVALRILAAVAGGYAFSAATVAFGAVALTMLTPLPRSEATVLMAMLGFLIYLVALLWGFSERRVWLVWLALVGGAGFLCLATWFLAPMLSTLGGEN